MQIPKDELIRIAREAGFRIDPFYFDELSKFAELVAARERELCIEDCAQHYSVENIAEMCVDAIRQRSQP